MKFNANFGISTSNPDRAAIEVKIIGPKNQARGKLKKSVTIELGIPIRITKKNFLDNNLDKFSLLIFKFELIKSYWEIDIKLCFMFNIILLT